MSHFIDAIQYQYGDFSGKATRQQFWMFYLCYFVLYFVVTIVDGVIPAMDIPFLTVGFGLATFIPAISITCRRLHDTGRSGWWYLIGFVPLVGWVVLVVFLVQGPRVNNGYTQDIHPGRPAGLGLKDE